MSTEAALKTISYSANNSGGVDWLKDKDWRALEDAGWTVDWFGDGKRFAWGASKDFPSMKQAITEWEDLTGQCSSDLGCACCGAPHSFSSNTGEYYSPEFPTRGEEYDG